MSEWAGWATAQGLTWTGRQSLVAGKLWNPSTHPSCYDILDKGHQESIFPLLESFPLCFFGY